MDQVPKRNCLTLAMRGGAFHPTRVRSFSRVKGTQKKSLPSVYEARFSYMSWHLPRIPLTWAFGSEPGEEWGNGENGERMGGKWGENGENVENGENGENGENEEIWRMGRIWRIGRIMRIGRIRKI